MFVLLDGVFFFFLNNDAAPLAPTPDRSHKHAKLTQPGRKSAGKEARFHIVAH